MNTTSLLGSLIAGATTLRMCAQADDALAHVQRISDSAATHQCVGYGTIPGTTFLG
jgi:hypothetical protein